MTITPTHEAEAFLSLLWQNIYKRVRLMMHPHHKEHEPSGLDFVRLPVGALEDVELDLDTAAIGHVLTITAVADDNALTWSNDVGGGSHQAYFYVPLDGGTIPTIPPGPKNLSAKDRTILAVETLTDGTVTATVTGAGVWTSGTRLSVSISSASVDATYFVVDWSIG